MKAPISTIEVGFHMWKFDNGKIVKGLINRRIKEIDLFKKKILNSNIMEGIKKFFKEQKKKIFIVLGVIALFVVVKKLIKK
jgi:hypothetical protein